MATGDVVGIINSDDFFHRNDTFDIIAQSFSDSNTQAIYADELDVDEENTGMEPWLYSDAFFRT